MSNDGALGVVDELALYMAGARRKALPPAVIEKTKHHILDTMAAMISGQPLLPGKKAVAYARSRGGVAEATVLGTNIVTSIEGAALANGMLAHSDETDDSHAPSQTHPGCGIIAAALAMAEARGANGADLMRAVALGYDIGTRFTMCLDALPVSRGRSLHSQLWPHLRRRRSCGLTRPPERRARCTTCSRTRGSRRPASVRGLAISITSRRHSTLAACPRVTASLPRPSSSTGSPPPTTCSRGRATSFRRTPTPDASADPSVLTNGLGTAFEITNTNIKRWSVGRRSRRPWIPSSS